MDTTKPYATPEVTSTYATNALKKAVCIKFSFSCEMAVPFLPFLLTSFCLL